MPSFPARRKMAARVPPHPRAARRGLGSGAAAGGEGQDADHADFASERHGQNVADAQAGVRLVGGLAVDAEPALFGEGGTVGAGTHDPGAPEPLVQPLPVTVFLLGNWRALLPGVDYRKRRARGTGGGAVRHQGGAGVGMDLVLATRLGQRLTSRARRGHI